ncbi:MAG: gamma-glutamyltransferase family protein [Rhodospirillales bacterium]|nr:gamma-glutamyltransferase family protein [Rhodospirillales bacterium]
MLGGCSSWFDDSPPAETGQLEVVTGFFGGVAADEPQAALIGREILANGGNAADAATAMYFAMAVTLPSRASLGGGGVCLAFDAKRGETRALDFTAPAPAVIPASADRPSAVPANVRGFYVLHARYGRLRFSQVVAPADNLARFGFQVSRALADDVAEVHDALRAEPTVRQVFATGPDGRLLREGDRLVQLDLAATLSRIRSEGPGALYAGAQAGLVVDAVRSAGGSLDRSDLANVKPAWRETVRVGVGDEIAHFAPPPPDGGGIAAQMWAMLVQSSRYADAAADERAHLIIEAAARAFAQRGSWPPPAAPGAGGGRPAVPSPIAGDTISRLMADYRPDRATAVVERAAPAENAAAASLAAADRFGNAVACAVTPNSLFGTGRIAPSTGIILAAVPDAGGRGAAMLVPMLIVNENVNEFYFAGAASGGVAAPTALIQVAARTMLAKEPAGTAIAARRVHGGSSPRQVLAEPALDAGVLGGLRTRGHAVSTTPRLGSVNVVACPDGVPPNPESCEAASDPRGYGLAAMGR